MELHPLAGKSANLLPLVDTKALVKAYYEELPDGRIKSELVSFGTSGHRGSSVKRSFNENHIFAITQSIVLYRKLKKIEGPLFIGMDTHVLSEPALRSVVEVLIANGIEIKISKDSPYTPTPVVSHAILSHNKGRKQQLADGIIITPSHNPPGEGGIKYNPPHGGPAEVEITSWIEKKANEFLLNRLDGVQRTPYEKAVKSPLIQTHDYITSYVSDLSHVVDMDLLRSSQISLGVDPLGGAGVGYWKTIQERFGLNLKIVNEAIDQTFRFMTLDWDGEIRMDPSSPYAMKGLIGMKDRFDIAFACDTDHDRHGIVTKSSGLLPPNHFLASCIFYLFQHRKNWKTNSRIGKTAVSSLIIDRLGKKLGREVYEVPVGFKWFVEGLVDGSLAFVGEESAGASFLRFDGTTWTTDKDGIILSLLAAEMTAKLGKDPGEIYASLTGEFGNPAYERFEFRCTPQEKEVLKKISPDQVRLKTLAGEKIEAILNVAKGNKVSLGGLKVVTENSWFAVRPSGTEEMYKIYAESLLGEEHLKQVAREAEEVVSDLLGSKKENLIEASS